MKLCWIARHALIYSMLLPLQIAKADAQIRRAILYVPNPNLSSVFDCTVVRPNITNLTLPKKKRIEIFNQQKKLLTIESDNFGLISKIVDGKESFAIKSTKDDLHVKYYLNTELRQRVSLSCLSDNNEIELICKNGVRVDTFKYKLQIFFEHHSDAITALNTVLLDAHYYDVQNKLYEIVEHIGLRESLDAERSLIN